MNKYKEPPKKLLASYKVQKSCLNCKHVDEDYDTYEGGYFYYCTLDSIRDEGEKYESGMFVYEVSTAGICDMYKGKDPDVQ